MAQTTFQPVTVTPKPFYTSTTFLINAGFIVIMALKVGLSTGYISDPDLTAIAVAVINLLNRFRTSTPVVPGF